MKVMAEPGRPSFHESWEEMLAKHRERISAPQEKEQAREVLKEVVREHIEETRAVPQVPPQVPPKPPSLPSPKAEQVRSMSEERQVQYLAELALTEGLAPAVSLAEELGSPYVTDAFHDLLVDRLWEDFIERWHINPREA